jgi:MFS family permease
MKKLFEGLPGQVPILATMAFIVAVGFGVQSPAIPVFAEHLGVGSTAVGALVSAFALMRLVSGPIGGRLGSRLGDIRVLIAGMFLLATTSVVAGLSQNFVQLLIMRGAGGIGSALYSVSALGLLFRVTPRELTGRAVGLFQGAFYSGTVIGPALGGLMTPFSPRIPFFTYGAAAALGGVVAVFALRRTASGEEDTERVRPPMKLVEALRQYRYRAALASNFSIGWAVFGVRVSVIPLFLLDVINAQAVWIGVGLSVCAVVQAFTLPRAGRLADAWPTRRSLVIGELVVVAGYLALLIGRSVPAYLVGLALLGLGVSFVTTGGSRLISQVTDGRGGVVVGVYQSGADAGMVVGPLLAGFLAQHYGYDLALGVTVAVLLIAIGLAANLTEEKSRPGDAQWLPDDAQEAGAA